MRAGGINLFGDDITIEYTPHEAVHKMYEKCVEELHMGCCDDKQAELSALVNGLSQALSELERLDEIEKKIMDLLCK